MTTDNYWNETRTFQWDTDSTIKQVTYQPLQRLVLAISVGTSYEIINDEIDEIDHNLRLFFKWFNDTFYGQKYERLSACKYTIHLSSC